MFLNYVLYYALPFIVVFEFTNNRIRYTRVWSQHDGFGWGLAMLLLILFLILWTWIDFAFITATPANVAETYAYKVLAALLGSFLAWYLVSLHDLSSISDLYWAPRSETAGRTVLLAPGGLPQQTPRTNPLYGDGISGGTTEKWVFGLIWFLELVMMIGASFFFFIGNPESAGDTTAAMAWGMGLYAGTLTVVPILFWILYMIIGNARRGEMYPAGPMFGQDPVYKHRLFVKYFWWTVANVVVVISSALLQIFITHPGAWVAGVFAYSWPFWYILQSVALLILVSFIYHVVSMFRGGTAMAGNSASFVNNWNAATNKKA